MSKRWLVDVPFVGSYSVEVYADTEEEAIDVALDVDWIDEIRVNPGVELGEVEQHRALVSGNVVHVLLYKAEAEELDEEGADE